MVQISVVTGANRGLGRTIALTILDYYSKSEVKFNNENHHLILAARNTSQLEQVKKELEASAGKHGLNANVYIVGNVELNDIEALDSHLNKINNIIKGIVSQDEFKNDSDKKIVLFNNAGSLGDISKKGSEMTAKEVNEYDAINFASFVGFSAAFKKWKQAADFTKSFIVNISSLAAIKPFVYNSLYCSIKASRDMFMQVYALEEPTIKVLNYSPGPLNNDMQEEMRTKLGDEENRLMFKSYFEEKKLVDMNDTATKLLDMLHHDDFSSGSHIDYFD